MARIPQVVRWTVNLLASYGLACVLFLFLLLLTYLGTLRQVDLGLYDTQQKYFESVFLVHEFFGVLPVPLPGGYLLLALVFVNLSCGIIVRFARGRPRIGVLIAHVGILVLLVGSFITGQFSIDGHMTLYEHERSDIFESYHVWEIAVAEAGNNGPVTEHIISEEGFRSLAAGDTMTFYGDGLPFSITLSGYSKNAMPQQTGATLAVDAKVVDGFYLLPLAPLKEHGRNLPGVYATFNDSAGVQEAILWGAQRFPVTVVFGDKTYSVDLRRRRWTVPFTIVLDKFTRELHPRTNMPKVFMSDVTKIENGGSQKIKISMNQPLRHKGYTFFQSSWGPADAGPNDPLYSTFAVVKNPADKFPLYACVIITFGLLVHFTVRLGNHLRREGKQRS